MAGRCGIHGPQCKRLAACACVCRQGEVAQLAEAVQACLQCKLSPYTLLWSHLAHACMGKGAEAEVGAHAAGAN